MNRAIGYIALIFACLVSATSLSQTYGNEWIKYDQSYYSFKVYPGTATPGGFSDLSNLETGIHKIDYNTLISSGIDPSLFTSENIQIFGREKEIPLYIEDGGDSSIDTLDYILFYTERNDGWLDSTIYENEDGIGNPFYSLFTDTIQYFFTWNKSTDNLRFTEEDTTNFNDFTPAEYVNYKRWTSWRQQYQEGLRLSKGSSSFYTSGEGWSRNRQNGVLGGSSSLFNFSAVQIAHPFQGINAPLVTFEAMQVGESNAEYSALGNHHIKWSIGASNYTLTDSIWIGYKGIKIKKQFPTSILPASGGVNLIGEIINDQGALTDYQSISFFSINYPRTPNFDGDNKFEFDISHNTTESKTRIDFTNVSFIDPIIFVLGESPKKVSVFNNTGLITTLISNSSDGSEQHVIYQERSTIRSVQTMSPVNGTSNFTDFSAISDKEDALLFIEHDRLLAASSLYADYRRSINGGSYNVIEANIKELEQQFGGGIRQHANAIRRFSHLMYNQAIEKPVGLFLLGKSIKQANIESTGTRHNPTFFAESLIPSFGEPSSDICITAGLEGAYKWAPIIPTGRISARSDSELESYLDKVIQLENNQDSTDIYDTANKDWQKQILHFVGGSSGAQQNQFRTYMDNMKNIISDSLFGASVKSTYKTDSDPLTPSDLSEITERISDGVSLMTYFGHSTSNDSGFEINLDEPTNWNNNGKFPIMLVNACYNGNIFQYSKSKSEEFVLTPDFGAIAYIASVNVGYDIYLNFYSRNLYEQFSRYNYGETVAKQMQQNIQNIETPSSNLYLETTCTQMLLHGDPMVKLNYHAKPEIELLEENVWFTPENPDLTVDSIEVHIKLKNLGVSITDTFSLEITRDFPSSSVDSIYVFQLTNLHYEKEFTFKVPLQPNISLGINTFNIKADIPSYIDEIYDEVNNNQITKTLFLDIDGIVPVIPYEFAVVPNDSVTVRASTNNPIADYNSYRFEIDTVDFVGTVPQSSEYRYAIVSGFGGVKDVNPSDWLSVSTGLTDSLLCKDSTVYFWRVSIVGDTNWRESSFQYIKDRTGWGQDHFYQFKKNSFYNTNYNRAARNRTFFPNNKLLECNVLGNFSWSTFYENDYSIDGNQMEYGIGVGFGYKLLVAVIDPVTLKPWGTKYTDGSGVTHNPGNNFGNNNNENSHIWEYFEYVQTSAGQLSSFQNLVNNIVPDGFYILVYTPIDARYDQWNALDSANMYNTFASLGSDSIIPGRTNTPFAFFVKKGDPSTMVEVVAENTLDRIHLEANLIGSNYLGQESSTLIGPSSDWGNVYWKQDPSESPTEDTTTLKINAYDINGVLQNTIETEFTLNDSIINLNSIVDASQYPYIDLTAGYYDSTDFTPSQIDRWHVLYSPLPEAAIDGSTQFSWSAIGDTVKEGEELSFAVDVKNIFSVDMDSLLITYWVEDVNHVKHFIDYARQDSLLVGETLRDEITFSTVGFGGENIFWMEVNPYINGSAVVTDQPEQEHFNNLLQLPFSVFADDENPLLDVTFNGNHILNGDIVNPNSEIYITLKDDNEFLVMDNVADTAEFGIYLTSPSGQQTRIPFVDATGNTIMQWIPANSQNKRFKIIWPAAFEKDGTYTLFVQGTDKSGNLSGDIDYRVNFEVIHESTITNMMNYPNPFSTSTRFVFTLTGSEVPDDIIIQIMTVTGRVVREITEDQLGLINIGRNITEYAWDGTDEFGDPLANGVYLYNVKAKINGENIKHRESGADQHFKKNFGKMYLLR